MGEHDVQVVREGWRHYAAGDLEAVLPFFAEDIEWDVSALPLWPDEHVYRGHDGVRRFWEQWLSAWDDYEARLEEIVEAGAEVVAIGHQWGTAKASGARVEMSFASVFTVRGGLITRMRMFLTPDEALMAADAQ